MTIRLATIFATLIFCCTAALISCSAATLIVTTAADTVDGACDTDCSLREAVVASNPGDSIAFSPFFNSPQTITLTLGQIPITSNLTIAGPGSGLLSVSGNNAGRIFRISGGAVVTLTGMTLKNGRVGANINDVFGGAILVTDSTLALMNMSLSHNSAFFSSTNPSIELGYGGAIHASRSTVSVGNSTFFNNFAKFGGAIGSDGVLNISGSTISNNTGGGGIWCGGYLTITNSMLNGNSGAAIYQNGIGGRLDLVNSEIANNNGGVYGADGGNLHIEGTRIHNNNNGLGLINQGVATIVKSTISNNSGGIRNYRSLNVNDSTISGNQLTGSGGGIYNSGQLIVTNSTVSGNSALGGGSTDGHGGGIYNGPGGSVTLTNNTIANNSGTRTGGGVSQFSSETILMRNTIIAGNMAGGMTRDAFGAFVSQGFNLIGNTLGSIGWGGSDLVNQNPVLAPLANNGGATQTHALSPYSPAVNGGSNALAIDPATNRELFRDQRGFSRTALCSPGVCTVDIGAFEAQEPATLSGRVLSSDGRAVSNARIMLMDVAGTSIYAQTNQLGYYNLPNLSVGATYTVTVVHKSYQFGSPQVVSIVNPNGFLNFVALP